MGRIFKRGELKQAVLIVLDALGEGHGYAIMNELKNQVGGGWKPSPGAIYPALLALVEQGLVAASDQDGTRIYSVTEAGKVEARSAAMTSRWSTFSARAEAGAERVTVGSLLDEFSSSSPIRRRLPGHEARVRIEQILARTGTEIENVLNEGESDG